jgi:hypothetical protein
MVRWPWKGFVLERDTSVGQGSRRRRQTNLSAECEALDRRQLLSTVAPAASGFLMPPAAAVTSAAAILEADAPKAFAQFQTALAKAEQQSHFNQPDVSALAHDEAVVDEDIQSAALTSGTGNDLNQVQDWVDYAFTYGSIGIHVGKKEIPLSHASRALDGLLGDVPAVLNASGSETSTSPIDQLIDQIKVVAKQAKVTPATRSALSGSYTTLNKALGPNPFTNLGPGASNRDALVVYYDAQVNNFGS